MKLFNTLTRAAEEVQPNSQGKIGLYACGPTVYDFAHIGHMRKYTLDDVLVRALRHAGNTVTHVMNITDVGHLVSDGDEGEDKMEKGARKYGKSVWDVAHGFEDFFWKGIDAMNIKRPDVSCRATEYIPEQIALVQKLEEKGFTYTIADGVYFDSTKFAEYGKLAQLHIEDMKAGARVEMVEGKKHPTDFALWKFVVGDSGPRRQMEWWYKGPFAGKLFNVRDLQEFLFECIDRKISEAKKSEVIDTIGFPGWHIECSAMSMKFLGDQFEIHTGGIDHIPVHHPNEIAQSEAATGKKPFVKIWVHHNFLRIEGEKMSKSLGNFYTMDNVVQRGYSPMAFRLLLLSAHYRDELNFTWENLKASQTAWQRLLDQARRYRTEDGRTELSDEKLQKIDEFRSRFFSAIENDLHTPEALAVMWEMLKSNIPSGDKWDLLKEFDEVLGLNIEQEAAKVVENVEVPAEIQTLADQRWQAKQAKNFEWADALRKEIEEKGWVVEDKKELYEIFRL